MAARQKRVPGPRPVSDLVTIHLALRGIESGEVYTQIQQKIARFAKQDNKKM